MSSLTSTRPRIPSHYRIYAEPPDKDGDETLHLVCGQRRLKLKGHAFREFTRHVVPLLDGRRSFEEIHAEVREIFAAEDLAEALAFLDQHGALEDGSQLALDELEQERLRPQLNVFHDLGLNPAELQRRLADSRVAIFGLTPIGTTAARSLAATGLGCLRAVDAGDVRAADVYFNSEFRMADRGRPRVAALGLQCTYEPVSEPMQDDASVEGAIAGSHFVINALDDGNLSLMYRLNRLCLKARIPCISAASSGFEIAVGPSVFPGETACYMCYRMRLVACAPNSAAAFGYESYLERRKTDDSHHSASLVFGTAIAGQLAAVEVAKTLCGISQPITRGRLKVLDLRDLSSTLHVVLKKPWCPTCGTLKP